ncbi:MAG: hypothetical protein KY456_05380 [Chloroflexi bacterium]|nr:hypothetical protein [Chloroflexota bacterium]
MGDTLVDDGGRRDRPADLDLLQGVSAAMVSDAIPGVVVARMSARFPP